MIVSQFQPYVGGIKKSYFERIYLRATYVQEVCCLKTNTFFQNEYTTKNSKKEIKNPFIEKFSHHMHKSTACVD